MVYPNVHNMHTKRMSILKLLGAIFKNSMSMCLIMFLRFSLDIDILKLVVPFYQLLRNVRIFKIVKLSISPFHCQFFASRILKFPFRVPAHFMSVIPHSEVPHLSL